ncbi:DUF4111 domain-containing protein [Nesterenkonia salmonea]|uniref:DUF4111 domain-containing protein n=1 Tax=Nesterenkonia salmonea TaxID=1804987 RepID=A0A5R9BC85_9MICC|nr:aminoglycoside adenylyltransferase domain-containing protein [Nesterenkonia salmonea]TLP98255.1 DUF4111 domain-containing protein [Nesterenkonia salmonea]
MRTDPATLLKNLEPSLPTGILGLYLCGSAARGAQGPHSDLDLLAVLQESITHQERRQLVACLLTLSGWSGHAEHFPEAANRQPLEFTAVVRGDVVDWPYPPRLDFQFGEWLRSELMAGAVLESQPEPDLVAFIADACQNHVTLFGEPLYALLDPPPAELVRLACREGAPGLLQELPGDERNALLTLARMVTTLETGEIVPKDQAAHGLAAQLPPEDGSLMEAAAAEYLGQSVVDWPAHRDRVESLAQRLVSAICR